MVTLNKIYTRTGDKGSTRLASGATVSKSDMRVEAYGQVDEANACIGLARLHTEGELDDILARVQNELFDLGADLANPPNADEDPAVTLRIVDSQVDRIEREIDSLNAALSPLTSFILPGGAPAAAALHLARTVARRAERAAVGLMESGEPVSGASMRYLNRLSDLLFVASRAANGNGAGDVLWRPAATR